MTVRANWHLDLPDPPKVDPLGSSQFLDMGLSLKTAEPKLERMIEELHKREKALFEEGVTCSLRESTETTCSSCPLFGRGERAPLCSVGREQEQASSALLAKLHGR